MKFTTEGLNDGWRNDNEEDSREMLDYNILPDIRSGYFDPEITVEEVIKDYRLISEITEEEREEIEKALDDHFFELENEREAAEYMDELLYHEAIRMRPYMSALERYDWFGEVTYRYE